MINAVSSVWMYLLVTESLAWPTSDGHLGKTETVGDAREAMT